ncbi:3'-5' exonuclease [Candidatus Gracilibacteria bacterium]|nr:3'-5' exonuclease [Candidatus Gracilibacteria bacterium]
MRVVVFDTETTGIPSKGLSLDWQPYICQFAAVVYEVIDGELREVLRRDFLIKPAVAIEYEVVRVHGITNAMVADAPAFGDVAEEILELFASADCAVAHNLAFDEAVLRCELLRLGRDGDFLPEQRFDTMKETRDLCQLPGRHEGFKSPKLAELHQFLFGRGFEGAHNALADVLATGACLAELLKRGIFKPEEGGQGRLF